ncbi:hypothetical protein Q5P01_024093 [Channa striata]|uniref:Gasdermin pore forming domain-containing protein n=1 Tax=Channa striata TaxID=64152 RepID=A0AA88LMS8_CHASR|nr:hypothetical protein Q5P01_024093 [Channa striata]
MFAKKAKEIVGHLGAKAELIYNDSLNEKIEMLTLVKVKLLLENFSFSSKESQSQSAGASAKDPTGCGTAEADVSHQSKAESSASSFDLCNKRVDILALREICKDKCILKDTQHIFGMHKNHKRDKLAFVHTVVYNSTPVTIKNKDSGSGKVKGKMNFFGSLSAKVSRKKKAEFTVPKGYIIAFGLMEINIRDDKLNIPIGVTKEKQINNCGLRNLKGNQILPTQRPQQYNEEKEIKGIQSEGARALDWEERKEERPQEKEKKKEWENKDDEELEVEPEEEPVAS